LKTPTTLIPSQPKKLTDCCGALPPIIESRTRNKAANGETLIANEEEWVKPASKKQRRIQRDLQKQMLQRDEEAKKRKLKNRLKNEKKKQN
jgi:hypothetical protein